VKVSEWLREFQLTGIPPDVEDDPWIAFWCGWLSAPHGLLEVRFQERIDIAIKAAEFIEERAK
jgi:hypothetical protein